MFFFSYSTWLGSNCLYLEDLYVSPEARGLGAGKALLRHLAQLAVARDCGRFEWSVLDWNTPAIDFYKAAGVDNASEIDAVTSATKNKPRAGKLVAGSYHVNADGTDITGVSFPVKVLTPWALKNAKQVTDADSYDITVTLKGKESTTTYTGADALFENESYAYYKLSETPAYYITAWYNLLSGKWEFGKVHATETTVEGTTVELNTNGHHTTYEMKISGFDLDYKANKVYGVVLTTADGSEYGLHHVTNIWHGTKLGFNADDPYFASIIGKTITQIDRKSVV